MSSIAPPEIDYFEERRRVSGLKFEQLSVLTGIPYKRLWRFFNEDGLLTRIQVSKLREVLEVPPADQVEGPDGD